MRGASFPEGDDDCSYFFGAGCVRLLVEDGELGERTWLEEGTDCRENGVVHCCSCCHFGRVSRSWKRRNEFSMDGLDIG